MGSIINGTTKSRKETLLALTQVLTTNLWDPSISEKVSGKAIEDATIELSTISNNKSQPLGTGLMLTEDGIFLTDAHVIEPLVKKTKQKISRTLSKDLIVTWRNKEYPSEEIIVYNSLFDIAICYAQIKRPCRAIKFKTMPGRFVFPKMPVTLISRRDGTLYRQLGRVIGKDEYVTKYDMDIIEGIKIASHCIGGFSGSPVTHENKLIGLCRFGLKTKYGLHDITGFTPMENIERCLFSAFHYIGEQIGLK